MANLRLAVVAMAVCCGGTLARGEDADPFDPPVLEFSTIDIPWNQMNSGSDFADVFSFGGREYLVRVSGQVFVLEGGESSARFVGTLPIQPGSPAAQSVVAVALDPEFETTGNIYTFSARLGLRIVSRYNVGFNSNGDLMVHHGPEILFSAEISQYAHDAGDLAFGPDGLLYIAIPDGGSYSGPFTASQSLGSPLGKILRIDVRGEKNEEHPYAIPSDNPFLAVMGAIPELWAIGLREPTSLFFDPESGDLFFDDSGTVLHTEVNRQAANSSGGENYGWPFWNANTPGPSLPEESAGVENFVFPEIEGIKSADQEFRPGFLTPTVHPSDSRLGRLFVFSNRFGTDLLGASKRNAGWIVKSLTKIPLPSVQRLRRTSTGRMFLLGYSSAQVWEIVPTQRAMEPIIEAPTSQPINAIDVKLTTGTPGGRIHYTTDGTVPNRNSPWVESGSIIQVDGKPAVRAIAVRDDLDLSREAEFPLLFQVGQLRVAAQTGVFKESVVVKLETATNGVIIRYTLDGSDPLPDGEVSQKGLILWTGRNLRGSATKPGYLTAQFNGTTTIRHAAISEIYAGGVSQTGVVDGLRQDARFSSSLSLAVDHSDRLLIADGGNNRIRRIEPNGTVVTVAGGEPGFINGPAQNARFRDPASIAVATDGTLYIADRGNGAIRRMSPDGMVSTVVADVGGVREVFLSPQNEIFWSAWAEIRKLNSNGSHSRIAGTGGANRTSLSGAVWPIWHDGAILASSSNGLQRISLDGSITTLASSQIHEHTVGSRDGHLLSAKHFGSGICKDQLGNFYLARGSTVGKWRRTDDWIVTLGADFGSTTLQSIAVTKDGTIYTAPNYGQHIYRIVQSDRDDDGIQDEVERELPQFTVGVNDLTTPSPSGEGSAAISWLTGGQRFALSITAAQEGIGLEWPDFPNARVVIESSDDLVNWSTASGLINRPDELAAFDLPQAGRAGRIFFRLRLFPSSL